MGFIEKIIILQKRYDFLNPDLTTNETYSHFDNSLEVQTINDMSLYDYSILEEKMGVGVNHS